MVNFGLNSASILGIFLAVAGASLYFMRSVRPELSRDHDIFFAAVGLVCGCILLWSGWRLDPILQLSQFLLTGSAIFFAFEAIRLRGIATEQARRNTPIVDDDRPVSTVYRNAELDDRGDLYGEARYDPRRLEGARDPRDRRKPEYEAEARRSPKTRTRPERSGSTEPPRTRRSRPATPSPERYSERYSSSYDDYSEPTESPESYEDPSYPSSRSRRPRPDDSAAETPSRPRRRRASSPSSTRSAMPREEIEATPVDYVDYQPSDDSDEGSNFDEPSLSDTRYGDRELDRYGSSYEDDDEYPYEEPETDTYSSSYGSSDEDRYDDRYDDRDETRRTQGNFDY
ncbi:Ycf66 family protein [Lusitaniella coriacea]|uniref:Ycf66 family protein n=1 Tax=Lusitaniella coriacea TaxID=1983105 RepID=UPI003CEBA677